MRDERRRPEVGEGNDACASSLIPHPSSLRILPVLDLKEGQVVRGLGGRRQEYRPMVSQLTPSCQPVDVALAFRRHFGFKDLYLADLDAITGGAPALVLFAELQGLGFPLWVDAGVRHSGDALRLAEGGVEKIVLGLETLEGPAALESVGDELGWERLVFSLDLQAGQPLGNTSAWGKARAWDIAGRAVAMGVRRLIVLDLAQVGSGRGTGTEELCRSLAAAYPPLELIAGGGVRDVDDLRRLRQGGVRTVLVASALHDGGLRPEHLQDRKGSQRD
ncbi:MAG: hisA/hisF family protein [Planctomycetes bacterium]|nr:hisA/hisF family protein [Planctomycetota bacterium]